MPINELLGHRADYRTVEVFSGRAVQSQLIAIAHGRKWHCVMKTPVRGVVLYER